MENKQKICNGLCRLLRSTTGGSDIVSIQYDPLKETVEVLKDSGYRQEINVAMDSGMALIKDVMKQLRY